MPMTKRQKKVPLGRPLPPADDIEFSAEAMRQRGYNQAAVSAEKDGNDDFNAMLGAQVQEEQIDDA